MVAQATAESHQGSEPVHMQKNLPEQKLSPLATRASVSLSHDMPSFLLDVWLDCSKLLAFRDHNSHSRERALPQRRARQQELQPKAQQELVSGATSDDSAVNSADSGESSKEKFASQRREWRLAQGDQGGNEVDGDEGEDNEKVRDSDADDLESVAGKDEVRDLEVDEDEVLGEDTSGADDDIVEIHNDDDVDVPEDNGSSSGVWADIEPIAEDQSGARNDDARFDAGMPHDSDDDQVSEEAGRNGPSRGERSPDPASSSDEDSGESEGNGASGGSSGDEEDADDVDEEDDDEDEGGGATSTADASSSSRDAAPGEHSSSELAAPPAAVPPPAPAAGPARAAAPSDALAGKWFDLGAPADAPPRKAPRLPGARAPGPDAAPQAAGPLDRVVPLDRGVRRALDGDRGAMGEAAERVAVRGEATHYRLFFEPGAGRAAAAVRGEPASGARTRPQPEAGRAGAGARAGADGRGAGGEERAVAVDADGTEVPVPYGFGVPGGARQLTLQGSRDGADSAAGQDSARPPEKEQLACCLAWMEAAARANVTRAQWLLGCCYLDGHGVEVWARLQ